MSIKKILIFTSLFFSIFFSIGFIEDELHINNLIVNLNEKNENYNKIKLLKKATNNKIVVNATLDKEVDNYNLSWFVAWSSTGIGKANDYVKLIPSTDTKSCTIQLIKPFTSQIKLICTYNSKPSIQAFATIDYLSRNPKVTYYSDSWSELAWYHPDSETISSFINWGIFQYLDLYADTSLIGGSISSFYSILSGETLTSFRFYFSRTDYIDVTNSSKDSFYSLTLSNALIKYFEEYTIFDGSFYERVYADEIVGISIKYNIRYMLPGDWEYRYDSEIYTCEFFFSYDWESFIGGNL